MALPKVERKERIRQYIDGKIHVTVPTLCRMFEVSEATVRRDLDELEREKLIRRTHGGASPLAPRARESLVGRRRLQQNREKDAIARAAAELIADGETIFLGSGSSVLAIAPYLKQRKELTVITNSLPIINELVEAEGVKVIVVGGWLRKSELSMLGHIAEKSLEELRADKVIVGSEAIHLEHGLTNSYLPETRTDRAIVKLTSRIVLLADHTKFNRTKTAFWAPLDVVDTVVCDAGVPETDLDALRAKGLSIIVAEIVEEPVSGKSSP
jgi:DeoR/GlpR family transcriptional regulator of sugar metabolism